MGAQRRSPWHVRMPEGDLDARRRLMCSNPPSATREHPCSEFRQRRFAGGVTGLEESLWPFALQQMSLSDAPAGRHVSMELFTVDWKT
jgi:hypothetical protein